MDIESSNNGDVSLKENRPSLYGHYSFENTEQTFIELASEQRLSYFIQIK